jgi:diaminohydroxyphosphoribosylaminopyrimidine deaminase/5-amino-6-(5-phosphoribosylamino)uracil reductase
MQQLAYMRRALMLAKRAVGSTSPNPMVGALLVRDDVIIGEGFHKQAGKPHAEIEALRDAKRRGNAVRGAALYVTLEPCCTFGRTPPCTTAILEAGITEVYVAAVDPNPAHRGRGLDLLRNSGVKVTTGLLEQEATQLNKFFNHWIQHRLPFITLKAAMTLDGKIATRTRQSKWITSEASRVYAMRLRQRHDAILVGIGTVLADNPSLTLRGRRKRTPLVRIVLDPAAETPLNSNLLKNQAQGKTILFTGTAALAEKVRQLSQVAQVYSVQCAGKQLDIQAVLSTLAQLNITSVLVEGGGETHAQFLQAKAAQEIAFFYAPKIVGGSEARRAVGGVGLAPDQKVSLSAMSWRSFGPDLFLSGKIQYGP